jgi:predicted nucleic acid-binding protein
MTAATYVDSSAVVKLVAQEKESAALRRYLHRHQPLVSSALARTEVLRALLPLGERAVERGRDALGRIELIRVSDRILAAAGILPPFHLRSLDAIHLATATAVRADLARLCTYDERLATAATASGWKVVAPA